MARKDDPMIGGIERERRDYTTPPNIAYIRFIDGTVLMPEAVNKKEMEA